MCHYMRRPINIFFNYQPTSILEYLEVSFRKEVRCHRQTYKPTRQTPLFRHSLKTRYNKISIFVKKIPRKTKIR